MYKIGLSSCSKPLNEQLFSDFASNGIDAIEISPRYSEVKDLDYRAVKKLSEQYGIELWSFHLPFLPFSEVEMSVPNPEVRNNTLRYFSEIIKKASDIGIDKFVVHPSGESIELVERKDRMECCKDSLVKLAEIADKYGSVIAVEDLPRTCLGNCAGEILELISVDDRLKVCFDTNHLLTEDNADFVRRVGDKIITLHVSDYDRINERHWLPGEGVIDWASVLKALDEVGYRGVWMYEISYECPNTISRPRALNCEDFARNAKELFAGERPTVFSSHIL